MVHMLDMLDTVDWIGDGDDADFCQAIERVFDIRLRSRLPWTTFGDVREHVVAQIAARGHAGTICATQMTFYRIRSALGLGREVGPETPVAGLVGKRMRQAFNDLEADTGLKMPTTRAGWLGIVGGLCFVAAVAVLALATLPPLLRIFAAGASAYVGLWLRHSDPRRLPHGCNTIGDLARMVTDQNRGRLARDGARLTDPEIWQIIQRLAAQESGINPDLIGPGTTFFRSKKRAA
jgi:hypothetical protein